MLALAALQSAPAAETASEPAAEPWRYVHAWLTAERDRMAADLERAHGVLVEKARAAGETVLIEKLGDPPRPRPHGWGILPEIVEDQPVADVETRSTVYSLETLSTSFTGDFRDAAVLAAQVASPDAPSLESEVDEFVRLRERMQNLEDHLDYHAKWQVEVVAYRAWFGEHNRIIEKVREMRDLERRGAPAEQIAALRAEILDRLAPFRPTEGLRFERRGDDTRVLKLVVSTDIDDAAFLETVRRAVESTYNEAPAARARGVALEVEWKRIPVDELYPGGTPPAYGDVIDVDDHAGRFPAGDLVLTTGATSTHAWTGRSVLLGPGALEPRTLAHEFGHLLGFDDAYLRGFDGDPDGRFGATLVEWVGLQQDLMGSPARGPVTAEMIDRLIQSYGAEDS